MGKKLFAKTKIILIIIFITLVALIPHKNIYAVDGVVAIQSWHLVDSGKHLDYSNETFYYTYVEAAVSTWNAYKPGVIRKDSLSVIQDVVVIDYDEVSSAYAQTVSNGVIKLNRYKMKDASDDYRESACLHEFGHALGLDHNIMATVMYAGNKGYTELTIHDKASYDSSYERY